jgi:hypothetical protein
MVFETDWVLDGGVAAPGHDICSSEFRKQPGCD